MKLDNYRILPWSVLAPTIMAIIVAVFGKSLMVHNWFEIAYDDFAHSVIASLTYPLFLWFSYNSVRPAPLWLVNLFAMSLAVTCMAGKEVLEYMVVLFIHRPYFLDPFDTESDLLFGFGGMLSSCILCNLFFLKPIVYYDRTL